MLQQHAERILGHQRRRAGRRPPSSRCDALLCCIPCRKHGAVCHRRGGGPGPLQQAGEASSQDVLAGGRDGGKNRALFLLPLLPPLLRLATLVRRSVGPCSGLVCSGGDPRLPGEGVEGPLLVKPGEGLAQRGGWQQGVEHDDGVVRANHRQRPARLTTWPHAEQSLPHLKKRRTPGMLGDREIVDVWHTYVWGCATTDKIPARAPRLY